ncbi:hypothetical protein BGZ51_002397 [Haplosporangium sp. Z 767]|nr:hypothetical protein BGZ51_002397 [Haplosporangium sp. Z 767]
MASYPTEPYNVWAMPDNPSEDADLDMEDLVKVEVEAEGASTISSRSSSSSTSSPTAKYSTQTIRQKQGRQLLSSMMTASATETGAETVAAECTLADTEAGHSTISKSTTKTTTTTTKRTTATAETEDGAGREISIGTGVSNGKAFPSVGLYQGFGRVQAYSAMAFGCFAFIHLVPPALASVGGVEVANKALIWGRVYYQTYGIEQVLVYGSLIAHVGAGVCKAAIRLVWKAKAYYTSSRPITGTQNGTHTTFSSSTSSSAAAITSTTTTITTTTSSSVSSGSSSGSTPGLFPYHRLIGWLLAPLVLGHMDTMRAAPVRVFGDSSMLDYSFVTYLHRIHRPEPYWLLVGFMAYHMIGGVPVAFNMALPKGSARRIKAKELIQSRRTRGVVAGLVTTAVMVGAYRIMFAEGTIPMTRLYGMLL